MTPRYYPADLAFFASQLPYLGLSTPARAARVLNHMVPVLEAYQHDIQSSFARQIEPLAFWCATLDALGAASNLGFIEALIAASDWRYTVIAGWLCVLCPRLYPHSCSDNAPSKLAAVSQDAHNNNWGLEVVGCEQGGRAVHKTHEHVYALILRARAVLAHVDIVEMPLRHVGSDHDRLMADARQAVLQAYRSGGLDAATHALYNNAIYDYVMPYPQWYRAVRRRSEDPSWRR